MSNSAKVSYGREGKGRVFLGWGRGSCSFELDEQTGRPIENKWKCLSTTQDPNVSALLISRAKTILLKEQQENELEQRFTGQTDEFEQSFKEIFINKEEK